MINSIRFLILPTLIGAFTIPVMAGDLVTFAPPEGKGKPKDECNDPAGCDGDGGTGDVYAPPSVDTAVYQEWMDPDIETAWGSATGAGVAITVVDSFSGKNKIRADLGTGRQRLLHGEWTHLQASMIAPAATMFWDDFLDDKEVTLQSGVFNVLNLSYGWIGNASEDGDFASTSQETSILNAASGNLALISKSAGNDGDLFSGYHPSVGETVGGTYDHLSRGLIEVIEGYEGGTYDGTSVGGYEYAPIIFAGSLDGVGSSEISYYSNIPGDDASVQNHFLYVGVDYGQTSLAGTSFAAPIISGYAAIVADKFNTTTPSLVSAQLLETARTDAWGGSYDPSLHGQGEACITCALSPVTLD